VEEERPTPTEEDRAVEQAWWCYDKLYRKYMIMYCCLTSEEERAAMAGPTGWRPAIPTDVSLEEQIRTMQARLDAM
jgi:hypothetical protein